MPGLRLVIRAAELENKKAHVCSLSCCRNGELQVAASILSGLKRGSYTLPGPDLGLTLHTDAMQVSRCDHHLLHSRTMYDRQFSCSPISLLQGLVPRSLLNTCCSMLVGWAVPLVHCIHGIIFDRIARRHARARFSALRVPSHAE